jgi:hypothetical protein
MVDALGLRGLARVMTGHVTRPPWMKTNTQSYTEGGQGRDFTRKSA